MALPQSTDGIRCMLSGAMRHSKAVWIEDTRITVEHILAQDPRAAYNKAKDYIYGMRYGSFDIRFVADSHAGTIEIVDVVECIDGYHKVK